MELEEISKEPERSVSAGEGTSATAEKKEEAETDLYSSLQSPPEDLYSETTFHTPPSKTKAGLWGLQDVRLWRAVSLCLGSICLLLILVIVLLAIKFQSNSVAACQETPHFSVSKQVIVASHKRCQSDQCAQGWLHFGDSCFFLSTVRKTWDAAQKNCSDQGGSLAVVSRPSLQNFLTQSGSLMYWIGLRYDQTWTWVDHTRLTQSYWSEESSSGNCVLLKGKVSSDKSWIRSSCTRPTYYICERGENKN